MSQTAQIVIAVIGLLTVIAGGAWISKTISKRRTSRSTQSGINITGDQNKVIGGDDNSKNE
jgi:hypothetical protein